VGPAWAGAGAAGGAVAAAGARAAAVGLGPSPEAATMEGTEEVGPQPGAEAGQQTFGALVGAWAT